MRCYLQFQLLHYLHLYPALRRASVIQGMFIIQMSTERERERERAAFILVSYFTAIY